MLFRFIFNLLFFSNVFCQSVFWEPEVPVPGGEITIYYNVIEGTLDDNTNPVFIHLGYNGWSDVDDYAMNLQPALGSGWFSYIYSIPEDAETVDFVFTDLLDNWDNNGGIGIDWHISLNYYWFPFNPGPNDEVEIVLNNVTLDSGGYIVWTVNDGLGFDMPLSYYLSDETSEITDLPWELNSIGTWVSTPLNENIENGAYYLNLGPFDSGEQIVRSIKYAILWEDGSWDTGDNGQIIFYDIYFDYSVGENEPYIFFQYPNNNAIVDPPITFTTLGDAINVEYWIDGILIGSDNTIPFQVTWNPIDGLFGDYEIVARGEGANGNISFNFLNISLDYEINNMQMPDSADDGLNFIEDNIIITLYAPNKEYVAIKGNWNYQYPHGELMNYDNGRWWYETSLNSGSYSYQFNIEGIKDIADPWSKNVQWQDPNGGGESGYYGQALTVFEVGASPYLWNDENFVRPELNEIVVYELHIGDFNSDGVNYGTYNDVIDKIQNGYFFDLGINVIELMPVNEFEGRYSWGYNPSFYMAPESSYGSPNELKALIDIAHQNGIAVLMDIVFDHLWGSSPLFQLYQPPDNYEWSSHNYDNCPYFHDIGFEWEWGYKLDHWKERTRKHLDDVLYHWIDEYHMDGFRFDYTAGIGWDNNSQFGANHYANMLNWDDPTLILIAEEDNAYQINNSGFDAGWDYTYHHMMFANLVGINYEGHTYGDMADLGAHIDAYNQGYADHTGQLIYIESHDETRIVHECIEYQGYDENQAFNISKLGMVILMTSEGIPMIYQGQELGQNGVTSHLNSQPMQWDNLNSNLGQDIFDYYSKLIDLRKNRIALKENNLELKYQNSLDKTISYWRISGNDEFVIVANFDDYDHQFNLEFPHSGIWYNLLDNNNIEIESNWYGNYTIPSKTAHLFSSNLGEEECLVGDVTLDGFLNVLDIVMLVNEILNGNITLNCTSDINDDGALNILDVVSLANMILN